MMGQGTGRLGELEGRRIVVSGAAGEIGRAACRIFAREGAQVGVLDIDGEGAARTLSEIAELGGHGVCVSCDIADEQETRDAVNEVAHALGGIDGAFCNAGIMPHQDRSFLEADTELWNQIFHINVFGAMYLAKYTVPYIEHAGCGSLVLMSSFLAQLGCSNPQDAYSASKGAILAMTRSMATQLAPRGIRVNAVAPGPIETPHVARFFSSESERERRRERFPAGRFGAAADVGEVVSFLMSDRASWVVGQVLTIDGGATINYV